MDEVINLQGIRKDDLLLTDGSQIVLAVYRSDDKEICYRRARTIGDPQKIVLESRNEEHEFDIEEFMDNNERDKVYVSYLQ